MGAGNQEGHAYWIPPGVISHKFLIKYYEYSFDFLIIIMDQLRLMRFLSIQYSLFLNWTQTYGNLLSS